MLLFERSQQAQFLKPTVITLVYGLGFGLFLVLLVVPALIAIQADVTRQIQALRRGARSQALQSLMLVSGMMMALWLAGTVGHAVIYGGVHPALAALLPVLPASPQIGLVILVFAFGAWALTMLIFLLAGLRFFLWQRRAAKS